METFGDWLEYYNNLDVTPFLEALETMKAFYSNLGITIFKDAVSLLGVSLQYILRDTLKRRDPTELYAPSAEAYGMLKAAVVGGLSLVFTRKHEVAKTRIRSHKYALARLTKRIVGFEANSLYSSTMLQEMPCGKETVVHYEDPQNPSTVESLVFRLRRKQWFGFTEVNIEVRRELWERFEESPPLFVNRSIGPDAIPQHMRDYLPGNARTFTQDQKKLLGVLSEKKMLLYAPLLEWYLDQGLLVKAVYRTIDYMPQKLFDWFVHV